MGARAVLGEFGRKMASNMYHFGFVMFLREYDSSVRDLNMFFLNVSIPYLVY